MSASGFLRCRGLPITNLVLNQSHLVIITEIHAGIRLNIIKQISRF
jgi:hypothetical protein